MNEYISYRETDCDWIGTIPSSWRLLRGRFLFRSIKEINHDMQCKNLLSLTYDGVLNKNFFGSEGLRPENYNTYQIFQKDNLVFKMIDLENVKTSRVGIVHEKGIMSSAYIRFEVIKTKIEPKFAYWFYYDLYKKEIYNSIGSGVRSTLSSSDLLEMELPVPRLEEQKLISSYLDNKTKQIDRLVEKIQKKIELLKEQRTALINRYVTKGLDPNVEMKDSGVEWIGMIPKHWHLRKLKSIGKFSKGKGITKDIVVDEGFPCIRCGEIYTSYDHKFSQTKSFIKEEAIENTVQASKGVLLFTGDGETSEEIGKCVLYDGDEKINIGGGINVFSLHKDDLSSTYLCYVVNSESVVFQKSREGRGEIVVHIYSKQLREIQIALPPIKEQKQIISHLDKAINAIDKTISLEAQRINLLKEYNQSLISSVVTGKVRVTEDMI